MSVREKERRNKRKNDSLESSFNMLMQRVELEYRKEILMRFVRDADNPDEALAYLQELYDDPTRTEPYIDVISRLNNKENDENE